MKSLRTFAILLLLLTTLVRAADETPAPNTADTPTKFLATDLFLDSGSSPLGAYQIEITAPHALLVGVEGGQPPAFHDAPFYDPAALSHGRVIVAAFHVGEDNPHGKLRIARLHWQLPSDANPADFAARLITATDNHGSTLTPALQLTPFAGDRP